MQANNANDGNESIANEERIKQATNDPGQDKGMSEDINQGSQTLGQEPIGTQKGTGDGNNGTHDPDRRGSTMAEPTLGSQTPGRGDSSSKKGKNKVGGKQPGNSGPGAALVPPTVPTPQPESRDNTTGAPEPDWQSTGDGSTAKRKRGSNEPEEPKTKGKRKTGKDAKRRKTVGQEAVQKRMDELEGSITRKTGELEGLTVQLGETVASVKAAKAACIKARADLQTIPLPVMQINGKNANGGGMSHPGGAQLELIGLNAKAITEEEYDDPFFGETPFDSDDELDLAVGKKGVINPPSPEHPGLVKSKGMTSQSGDSSPSTPMQAANPPMFSRVWPPKDKPGPVKAPHMPSWWLTVKKQSEKSPAWVDSCQFCKSCGDGGSSLKTVPCVRCAYCLLIYCVSDQDGRPQNKGCIDVPAFAINWLCPTCLRDCASRTIEHDPTLKMAESDMNMGYTVRHPELPGPPFIPRTPLLFLEIRCLKDELRKPFSVGGQFISLMQHAYGAHADGQISHCHFDVDSLSDVDTSPQVEAMTFLSKQTRCHVLITVDAHTFGDDGYINNSGSYGAPLPVLLWSILGKDLWTAVSRANGTKILVPFVCGWIWKKRDQVEWAAALFKDWILDLGGTKIAVPPLINNLLGFSTTSLVTWRVAPQITGLLSYLLLGDDPFLIQVKRHLLTNTSLMETTGIIVGYISEDKVHLQLATPKDIRQNFFGLPPPLRCGKCGQAVKLFSARAHTDRKYTWLESVHAECMFAGCEVTTPLYVAPTGTTSPHAPDVFFWNLPLGDVAWDWLPPGTKQEKVLPNAAPLE